jgi:hypothetical protein
MIILSLVIKGLKEVIEMPPTPIPPEAKYGTVQKTGEK